MLYTSAEHDVSIYSFFFFFKQKTAYEMRISDWSSDVCSSDLLGGAAKIAFLPPVHRRDIDAIEADHAPREFLQPECGAAERRQIGRASCRERVCQYV